MCLSSTPSFISKRLLLLREGPCDRCESDADIIDRCPCDKVTVSELGVDRKTCLDPIPTCGDVCDRKLSCGPVGNNHRCREKCHTGPCPPCPLTTKVSYRISFTLKRFCSSYNASIHVGPCSPTLGSFSVFSLLITELEGTGDCNVNNRNILDEFVLHDWKKVNLGIIRKIKW